VKVFVDLGCFAVGVDLNAGPRNRYVVSGDFNALQYSDESVDIVFTNSIEHAFDLGRLIHEARRVLKPGGRCILELHPGEEEGALVRNDEAISWRRCADVFALFERAGLSLQSRMGFSIPWDGEHAVFMKRAVA
jgi:SAM-dependent methyltransferase